MTATRRARAVLGVASLVLATPALAQWSGSVSALSDYRFRGVSLTRGDPALQASATYDHPSGAYAGALFSNVRLADQPAELQALGFAGYAARLSPTTSVDGGVTWSQFSGGDYAYGEIHAGASFDNVAARIAFSPNYFRQHVDTWYGEASGSLPLGARLRAVGHVGWLHFSAAAVYGGHRDVVDGSAGVAVDFDPLTVRVEWVGASAAGYAYPLASNAPRSTVVVTLTYRF